MLIPRAVALGGLVLVIGLISGCGGDGRLGVTGSVKYKSQSVKAGLISFIPEGGMAPAGGAPILDGTYTIPAAAGLPAGKYKVSISALDTKGAAKQEEMPGMSGPPPKETIPAKYNASTELTAEVKSGARNVFDFDLK